MAYGLDIMVTESGDRAVFETASNALRRTRPLMQQVGVLAMSSASERLTHVLRQDNAAVRSGRLMASIQAGVGGRGGGDTIFDLSDNRVEIGTNLVYAAQVQFGGTILPVNAKALAIPLLPQLQRLGLGPREIDPTGEALTFMPYTGDKPNVFGLLIDEGDAPTGRQRKQQARTAYGPGPLYALAYWVTQPPHPYLYWGEEDLRALQDELYPRWIRGEL